MPDSLTAEDVAEIAHLARLELDPAEIDSLRGELSAILDSMAVLQTLDTDSVEPMTHAVPMHLRLRVDQAAPSLPAERALAGTAQHAEDHFEVPSILETNAEEK